LLDSLTQLSFVFSLFKTLLSAASLLFVIAPNQIINFFHFFLPNTRLNFDFVLPSHNFTLNASRKSQARKGAGQSRQKTGCQKGGSQTAGTEESAGPKRRGSEQEAFSFADERHGETVGVPGGSLGAVERDTKRVRREETKGRQQGQGQEVRYSEVDIENLVETLSHQGSVDDIKQPLKPCRMLQTSRTLFSRLEGVNTGVQSIEYELRALQGEEPLQEDERDMADFIVDDDD
jgi:hypothetical protein